MLIIQEGRVLVFVRRIDLLSGGCITYYTFDRQGASLSRGVIYVPSKSSIGTQNISCTSSGLVLKCGDSSWKKMRAREE